mmetsp:Transcript_47257/g.110527  ORF Transcript_47257/g.110527 Transcript_47257/m.110527 type:complete len:235 (+) Transcript_47257:29-733(+)
MALASRQHAMSARQLLAVVLLVLLSQLPWEVPSFCAGHARRASAGRTALQAKAPEVKPEPDFGAEFAKSLKEGLGLNQPIDDVTAAQRVTPIDRLMGWDKGIIASRDDLDPFMDSCDEMNYVTVSVNKPLGLEFLENEVEEGGGVMIGKVEPQSNADQTGLLRSGYHLVFVNGMPVHGLSFDAALQPIIDAEGAVRLTFFMGEAEYFYGEWRPEKDWLDGFQAKLLSPSEDAEQ